MIILLFVALALTAVTVVIHASGTVAIIRQLARRWHQEDAPRHRRLAAEFQIVRVVSVLLLLHLVEAGVWACMYRLARLVPDIETAVYFSITSYTTVGYGDVVLQPPWRVLGPIEAAVGILMFGWSTGVMVTVINKIYGSRLRINPDPSAPR